MPANMKAMRNTAISNLFGWCALTMPVGLDANQMPVESAADGAAARRSAADRHRARHRALIGQGHALLGAPDLS
ncbi:MAG: hypothetical protein R3E56_16905 [Burkholderiaceae bacterium]